MSAGSDQSVELLNRELRAAHKSLVEPTPKSTLPAIGTNVSSQQQTPTSPTTPRLKTKRSKTSAEKPKTKKPLKTYGKSSQDIFEFHGGSDGELDVTQRVDLDHKAGKRKKNEHMKGDQAASRQSSQNEDVAKRPITSSGGHTEMLSRRAESKWNGISSAPEKEGFLQSSMPPPASKSLSFDQSQLSQQPQRDTPETIMKSAPTEPAMHNIIPPDGTDGTEYSERHADFRMSAHKSLLGGEVEGQRSGSVAGPMFSNEKTECVELRPTEEPAPSSSASEITPSKVITVKRTKQTKGVSEKTTLQQCVDRPISALEPNMPAMANPVVLLPEPTDTEGTQDELSAPLPNAASQNPAKSAKRKRETDGQPIDESDSDEIAIGIPKEQYQPRPSKRRSGGGDGEVLVPTDYSKRPEAMSKGKRKTKRHKTTAFQELLPQDEDDEDEEVKMIPDSRFDIPEMKLPKIPTKRNRPDVDKQGDLEETQPEAQREPNESANTTTQKKRGRPKKAVTTLSEEMVVDEAQADHNQDDTETEELVIPTTAKKSRKKSKAPDIPAPTIEDQSSIKDATLAVEETPEDPPINILNETPANAAKIVPETSPLKTNMAPPETPRKSTTPAPKGPDKHSPISSGKVAYRVGLSKRARIAPLLRIVRK